MRVKNATKTAGKKTTGSKVFGNKSSTGSSTTNTSANNKKTMDSITALGYGPITAAKLDQLVASGEVIEYTSNGVTLFKRAGVRTKNSKLQQQLAAPKLNLPTSKLRK